MQSSSQIDGERLRAAMRQVASPVVVITTNATQEMRGMTASSFASVSLNPPLVSFNVTKGTQMHSALEAGRQYAIHVLAADQAHLSQRFATPHLSSEAQFEGLDYQMEHDLPILKDTAAVFICKPFAEYPAGDHTLFLGEVVAIEHVTETSPLLYYKRAYHTLPIENAT